MRERERASRQRHFIFAQRYRRRAAATTTWKLCAKRAAPVVFLSPPRSSLIRVLSSTRRPPYVLRCPTSDPFRPSTLVIYRGYAVLAVESVPTDKGTGGKILPLEPANTRNAIVPIRSFALGAAPRVPLHRLLLPLATVASVPAAWLPIPLSSDHAEYADKRAADPMKRSNREMQRQCTACNSHQLGDVDFWSYLRRSMDIFI